LLLLVLLLHADTNASAPNASALMMPTIDARRIREPPIERFVPRG
jgi:hypothetical protein